MHRIRACALGVAVLILFGPLLARPADPPAPGRKCCVLLIVVDDLSTRLGCYGDAVAHTPQLDRLAARGTRFDRAYVSYPLSNPSRASLLLGRRPDSTRVIDANTSFPTTLPAALALPRWFREHGYTTARVGPLCLGEDEDARAWDLNDPVPPPGQPRPREGDAWGPSAAADDDLPDGRTAREAIALLDRLRSHTFFLAVGFRRPSPPLSVPRQYFGLYKPESIGVPAYYRQSGEDRSAVPPPALRPNLDLFPDKQPTSEKVREAIHAYRAATSFVDAQIGRVLAHLEQLKLQDRTIVVVVGDQGWHLGEHGLWGGRSLYEEATRVPLILAVPGKPAGSTARLAELVDLYPTLVELCRVPAPDGLEGNSLVPLLSEPKRLWKTAAFSQMREGEHEGRAVRTERWRYVEWDGGRAGVQLYDHEKDPDEKQNLARDPGHADIVKVLGKMLRDGPRAAGPPMP